MAASKCLDNGLYATYWNYLSRTISMFEEACEQMQLAVMMFCQTVITVIREMQMSALVANQIDFQHQLARYLIHLNFVYLPVSESVCPPARISSLPCVWAEWSVFPVCWLPSCYSIWSCSILSIVVCQKRFKSQSRNDEESHEGQQA